MDLSLPNRREEDDHGASRRSRPEARERQVRKRDRERQRERNDKSTRESSLLVFGQVERKRRREERGEWRGGLLKKSRRKKKRERQARLLRALLYRTERESGANVTLRSVAFEGRYFGATREAYFMILESVALSLSDNHCSPSPRKCRWSLHRARRQPAGRDPQASSNRWTVSCITSAADFLISCDRKCER